MAVWYHRKEMVTYLIENNVDLEKRNSSNRTALHLAAGRGNLEITKLLVESGADLEATQVTSVTILLDCIDEYSKIEIVEHLLEKGANPNTYNKMGDTPIKKARKYNREDIIKVLVSYGADPEFKSQIDYDKLFNKKQSKQKARLMMEDF